MIHTVIDRLFEQQAERHAWLTPAAASINKDRAHDFAVGEPWEADLDAYRSFTETGTPWKSAPESRQQGDAA